MNRYLKEFFKSAVLGIIIFIIILVFRTVVGEKIIFDHNLWIGFLYSMLYSITLYMANAYLFLKLDSIFKNERFSAGRIITGLIVSLVLSMLIVFLLRIFEDVIIEKKSLAIFFIEEKLSNYIGTFIITIIVILAIHAFYFYKALQDSRIKEQKIIAGTASAKFETLKNQLDPHFLFNSLNVLTSLIEENPEMAQKFTTSLSKIYRYVLEQKDKELVNVVEELDFAKIYIDLLKMRFEESVFYELSDRISNPEAKMVPLSLQLLLENTVKHNIASEIKPLYIKIYEKGDSLFVENNYQKKEVLQDRKGVGLQNIIDRYAIITNRKVKIAQTKDFFTVELPLLTKQISIMETNSHVTENSYLKAQKKVEAIKGFYGNLSSYVIIITGLAIVNLLTSSRHLWFIYPAVGWGIGVLFHGMSVFNYNFFLGKDWEEKKIRKIMEQNQSKSEKWE